jgi:hypothetical protein
MNEAIGIDFVGGSTGLQDAVLASQRALQALNRDTSRMSFTLGRIMRTIVAPIATVILSAFAAKRALAAFTQSTLPGAAQLNQSLAFMQFHVHRLAEAVGQLLAPAAERAANMISRIAQFLEPLIRRLTAAMPTIGANLRQMAMNLVGFLRPLMPTVFGIVDRIIGAFKNANWADVMATLQKAWLRAWNAIITFTAPILVRVVSLVDTVVRVVRDGLGVALDFVSRKAEQFGITLPNALRVGRSMAESLQAGILSVIAALEVAVENIPMLFKLVVSAGGVAIQFLSDNWRNFGQLIADISTAAGESFVAIFSNSFVAVDKALSPLAMNIYDSIYIAITRAIDDAIASIGNSLESAFNNVWASIERGVIGFQFVIRKALFYDFEMFFDSIIERHMPWFPGHQGKMERNAQNLRDLQSARDAALTALDMRMRMPSAFNNDRGPFALPASRPVGIDTSGLLNGLPGMPQMKMAAANMEEFNKVLEQVNKTFGSGVSKRVQDALLQGPRLVAQLMQGVIPGFGLGGAVAPRVDRMDMIGPLLFGSRDAAMHESNQASKNPMFTIAQQQLKLTADQLVEQRAARAAAERKARIANF